ncbi:9158_t:CDS:2, partial [Scutellospora calospora]
RKALREENSAQRSQDILLEERLGCLERAQSSEALSEHLERAQSSDALSEERLGCLEKTQSSTGWAAAQAENHTTFDCDSSRSKFAIYNKLTK